MEKPDLPVRVCKLPRFVGGCIGPRMGICETSGLPIPMVPRLHQSNGYIKRKLRVWRAEKCIALVDGETVLTSAGRKLPRFMWCSIGSAMEICEISGLPIPMVPRLHQRNGYIKRKLRVWRAQKCVALVGSESVLISVGPQTTPFNGGSIGTGMEICETSGLPIPMVKRLHQSNGYIKRKLRVWKAQKCIALVGVETVLTSVGPQTTPFHWGSKGIGMEICETSGLPIPMVPRLHQRNGYIKSKLRVWKAQKCIALVGVETVLTSVGPQTTPFHWGQ